MGDEGDASRRPLTHGSSLSQGTNDNSNAKNNDKDNNNGDGGPVETEILFYYETPAKETVILQVSW